MCTVKLRYTDKSVRYRFFVVPGDGPALFGNARYRFTNHTEKKYDIIGE